MKKSNSTVSFTLKALALCVLMAFGFSSFSFAKTTSGTSDKKSKDDYIQLIYQVFQTLQYSYVEEVDPEVLYKGALQGMLDSLDDPHTCYLDTDAWRDITDTTQGEFGGVGLSISKPAKNTPEKPAYVEVVQPIEGTPGYLAGIMAGDKIIEIDGVDVTTITMESVLNMLRGTVGESVTVKILRGKSYTFEKTLVRAIIENPTVKYGMIDSTGYVNVSSFGGNTATRFQEALDSFEKSGYTSLIVDLRYNGGGLLSSAVDIADKFIDSGDIVTTKSRIWYQNEEYKASSAKTTVKKNIPVIVLINGGSASASEILSGALKDHHIALLVGQKTFGKGSVQVPAQLRDNDGYKITIARYYSPSDTNIDRIGIPPDVEVKFPETTEDEYAIYEKIYEDEVIVKYVESHPNMSEKDIANYASSLRKKYNLESSVLRKLVRNEVERLQKPRLYDLDYDIQLNEALRIINSGEFAKLMAGTKTLKELQEIAEAQSQEN